MYFPLVSLVAVAAASSAHGVSPLGYTDCQTVEHGYDCDTPNSQFWGQYSPYFSVPSEISPNVPYGCSVTFAQVLSRHGARYPTSGSGATYEAVLAELQAAVDWSKVASEWQYLKTYNYSLGTSGDLTLFGQQQLYNSGIKFFERYESLASRADPFFRASSSPRVVESAQNFSQGFHAAKLAARFSDPSFPYSIEVLSEADNMNDTLENNDCPAFANDAPFNETGNDADAIWDDIFAPGVQASLQKVFPGYNLSTAQTVDFMDLCPFETVASSTGTPSKLCSLYTQEQFRQYDYEKTLDEYYNNGYGNYLGPTQGVGFANELIARLTNTKVKDVANINTTADYNPALFPLGRTLYADFSHDSQITSILSALDFYNTGVPLSNTTLTEPWQADGYSAAWTVPFAARVYFEKLQCQWQPEEFVRVLVNDRVLPLQQCGGNLLGLCTVEKFVDSLTFAQSGGRWNECA